MTASELRAILGDPALAADYRMAPFLRSRHVAGYLVEDSVKRVVPLSVGRTLIANQANLREHAFPERWFEASFVLIEIELGVARVSDARATNGGRLRGAPLPRAEWTKPLTLEAAEALAAGDARARASALCPAWVTLADGDDLIATYPQATWRFVFA